MAGKLKLFVYLLIILLVITISISYWKVQQDDAYIFYTYAKNIIEGNGYVFNPGERLNATTSPLYTLSLAFFSFIFQTVGLTIPIIAHLIGAVSLLASSYFMMKIFGKEDKFIVTLSIPILFLMNPLLKGAVGMETFLYMSLLLAALYFYKIGKLAQASLFIALSILTRFDGFLFGFIIFFDFILRKKQFPAIVPVITFFTILLPWFIFSKLYFGTFFPSTLAVKLSQAQIGSWGTGLIFLKGLMYAFVNNKILSLSIIVLLLFSFCLILFKGRNFFEEFTVNIILAWSVLYLLIYVFILNPPSYQWYYTPFTIIMSLIFAYAIDIILSKYFQMSKSKIVIVLFLFFILAVILPLKTLCNGVTPKFEKYKSAAEWLNQNVQQGASVAVDEIGIMGYYYNKGKIIDILGLINPEVIPHLLKCEYSWYIDKYKPDFILTDYPSPPKYSRIIFDNLFRNSYSTAVIIRTGNMSSIIFSRKYH
jgi:hypothetical protein